MAALKVLSVAVATGRVGYVFLDDGQLRDWGVSTSVSKKASDLVGFVQELINTLRPDVVVTEKCDEACRKGDKAKRLLRSVSELASHNYVLDVSVPRPRTFKTKYEEAKSLVERHKDLLGYLPKRKPRFYESEPRNLIVFEAVALAEAVIFGPPERLAAAMG
jgi:hypothetical protein